jgi:hypothetical protein
MATIKLQRTSEYVNLYRDYHIYLDGEKIGTLSNGKTKEFETTDGQHSLIAKIDWCSSPTLTFYVDKLKTKHIKVGGFKYSNWTMIIGFLLLVLGFVLNYLFDNEWSIFLPIPAFLLLIYYFTLGKNKYLTLKELN